MRDAIQRRQAGLLTYGITPPKRSYAPEKRAEIAGKQAARLTALPVDGLVIYDLQDESDRTDKARPFPFLETVNPVDYALDDLAAVTVPKIVYRCVSGLTAPALEASLTRLGSAGALTVFVGAASSRRESALRLPEAFALRRSGHADLPLGGVLIAERHAARGGEEGRVLRKMDAGCSFFVTQAVYSVTATRDALSDLYWRSLELEQPIPPILVTLSPCGSLKTLAFLRWLGIAVPRWMENELTHAKDTLQTSVELCSGILEDLVDFARQKQIPLGCNVESVSLSKTEIDASVELTLRARRILGG